MSFGVTEMFWARTMLHPDSRRKKINRPVRQACVYFTDPPGKTQMMKSQFKTCKAAGKDSELHHCCATHPLVTANHQQNVNETVKQAAVAVMAF